MAINSIVIEYLVRDIIDWLKSSFILDSPKDQLPQTWDIFWCLILEFIGTDATEEGLPLHPILIQPTNLFKEKFFINMGMRENSISYIDMLRCSDTQKRIPLYKALKYEMAVWYHVQTGRVVPGYSSSQPKRTKEDITDSPLKIVPLKDPNLIHGMIVKRVPVSNEFSLPYHSV